MRVSHRYRRIFRYLLVCLMVACTPAREESYQFRVMSFGTWIDVTLYDASPAQIERLRERIKNDLNTMHHAWHAWRPGTLQNVNAQLATLKPFEVSPEILALIKQSKQLSERSEGLFDPAISKLIRLWGFHSDTPSDERKPPDPSMIQQLLAKHPSMADIDIHGTSVQSRNTEVCLDWGGYAKGYGLDRLMEVIRSEGVKHALVNAGGDLYAMGRHGDRPWRVAIRDPRGEGVIASLDLLDGERIFTSGDYERSFIYQGKRYHHIIDPRTGYPAEGAMATTVVHQGDGAEAEASAMALLIAGSKDWQRIAKRMGMRYVLLIDQEGVLHMNEAMKARLMFPEGNTRKMIIVK